MADSRPTILWCVPRSLSTAFEKMMWSSTEFQVFSEPFLDLYKDSLQSADAAERVGEQMRQLCDAWLSNDGAKPVFVKEMAYHASPFVTDEFLARVHNVFLIRDPRLSIPSLYRMRADYAEPQTGFKGSGHYSNVCLA